MSSLRNEMSKNLIAQIKDYILRHIQACLFVTWLLAANLSYTILNNPLGWVITLGFFMCVPGYLLMQLLNRSRPRLGGLEVVSFSVGLSILLIMLTGLILNTTFLLGIHRPLSTPNIFISLDIMSLLLIATNLSRLKGRTLPKIQRPTAKQYAVIFLCALMPTLAIFGAIRLNNGASNILTLVLFAFIAIMLVWVALDRQLERLFPYVLFTMALGILLSTSLRGWYITGHDIQEEFVAFQLTAQNAHWSIAAFRNAYNACLSLTILPTVVLKLTSIPAAYVFKVVFQIMFAFSIIPIYLVMKTVSNKKTAFLGAFIFISFPEFLNDMPFLNRQEIGILFFALMLLAIFMKQRITNRERKILIVFSLIGIVLSHYSTMYITLMLLLIAGGINWVLKTKYKKHKAIIHSVITYRLVLIAFLLTLCWNLQLTNTAHGLDTAVSSTLHSLFDQSGEQANSVSYSLLGHQTQSQVELLSNYANKTASPIQYAAPPVLKVTKSGNTLAHIISPQTFNNILRGFSAKILQVFLLLGIIITFFRNRKKFSSEVIYYLSLCVGAVVLLVLETLLPDLSVDFGAERLFQQLLIILAVPMVIGLQKLIVWPGKKTIIAAVFLAILFLDLSGFVPEITGGYPPQLALNNSGIYYEAYYTHKAELLSSNWLLVNKKPSVPIEVDKYARNRFLSAIFLKSLDTTPLTSVIPSDYIYQDTANVTTNTYQLGIDSTQILYTLTENIDSQKSLIYNNGGSRIFK
jgi:uncharacterized membrane protein